MSTPIRSILRYHGSKWRIAPWIIKHFPPHRVYVEVFGGSASVLLRKPRSKVEVYNDVAGEVVNFFQVLRDPATCAELCRLLDRTAYSREEYDLAFEPVEESIESARRLVVKAYLGFGSNAGTRRSKCGFRGADWSSRQANNLAWPQVPERLAGAHERFLGVIIENRGFELLMGAQDRDTTLFYLDPPYVHSSRSGYAKDRSYLHEMTDEDHRRMAKLCHELEGLVLISGYHSPLYDELFHGWPYVEKEAFTQGNATDPKRTEVLWLSPRTAAALHGGALEMDLS